MAPRRSTAAAPGAALRTPLCLLAAPWARAGALPRPQVPQQPQQPHQARQPEQHRIDRQAGLAQGRGEPSEDDEQVHEVPPVQHPESLRARRRPLLDDAAAGLRLQGSVGAVALEGRPVAEDEATPEHCHLEQDLHSEDDPEKPLEDGKHPVHLKGRAGVAEGPAILHADPLDLGRHDHGVQNDQQGKNEFEGGARDEMADAPTGASLRHVRLWKRPLPR
mmetsp:Transcript_84228/g.265909  ORF Transcript_84228/g.265909 Transcript_84228/m.265909 type:complete len:220 (-) Transcript_84228:710-1369(-)